MATTEQRTEDTGTTSTTDRRPLLDTTCSDCGLSRSERSERTAELLEAAQACADEGDACDLHAQVVLINRGVAESVASRYRNRGVAIDDLHQVAYEGLTKAVARFDPELRNDLLTYAVPTIRGELQRYFRDQGWAVRPPRRIQETQSRATAVVNELEQKLGRAPSDAEIAAELGIDVEEYREAMAAQGCFRPTSLDQPTGVESTTLGDLLTDEQEEHEPAEARVMLAPVVRHLSARDQHILYLRFVEDLTQVEIGEDIGVTQMQVSRLLSRILSTLRAELGAAAG